MQTLKRPAERLFKSIWLFPVVLALVLVALTVFKISGSSMGEYGALFYGADYKDPALVAGQPRAIRSDEWLVNSAMTIAQQKNDYHRVNPNIGHGEDMSVLYDVPYKEWSEVFKPQNLAFFVMPFANAFAFHWWVMAFLLMISCYFFVLTLLPGRRLIAAALSLSLFFSAYIQWWYGYATIASVYYSLFIATAAIHMLRQGSLRRKLLLGSVLSYLLVSFALILYPPFQVSCGLVVAAFVIGMFLNHLRSWKKREAQINLMVLAGSGILALAVVAVFLLTRLDVVKTINDTAYPGQRTIQSGGFDPVHLLSSQLGYQFTQDKQADHYRISGHTTNQSEASNFLLLVPFTFLPSLLLLYDDRRKKQPIDWPFVFINLLFLVFLLEMFVSAFTPVAHLLLLTKVGAFRLVIGVGLLNLVAYVLFIRKLIEKKDFRFPRYSVAVYCLAVLAVILAVNLHVHHEFGTFVGIRHAVAFALPLPLVLYLLLKKHYLLSVSLYALFAIFIGLRINPLYRGVSVMTQNPVITAVARAGAGNSHAVWVSYGGYAENIAQMSGQKDISGVYMYPQLDLWKPIKGARLYDYNRYAHVGFEISDTDQQQAKLQLTSPDGFVVSANPCSPYLKQEHVNFILTASVLKDSCTELRATITVPVQTLYIYRLR